MVEFEIKLESDIVGCRQTGRCWASGLGCSSHTLVVISTVISELARNIITHAGSGHITLDEIRCAGKPGMLITAVDHGPGIPDLERALVGGYSTCGGFGLGLSGVRKLSDRFQIWSEIGYGTTVKAIKWVN